MSWNQHLLAFLVVLLNIAAAFATGEGSDLDCDPCIERPDYLVKVITHGTSNDEFWLKMRSSTLQAARDMRVAIEFQLYGKLMHLTRHVPCRTKYFLILTPHSRVMILSLLPFP